MDFLKCILTITFSFYLVSYAVESGNFGSNEIQYVCPPCPHVSDIITTKRYEHDGQCLVCGMNLIELNDQSLESNAKGEDISQAAINLHVGSGNFNFITTKGINISVFYHKPKAFGPNSKILLVIPGAGRGAWEYRDYWRENAEKYNVLILSPSYSEKDYDYAAYHLGGILSSLTFTNFTTKTHQGRVNKYFIDDDDLLKGEAVKASGWLFNDFDRIFDLAVKATHSNMKTYDLFGHSAGGQIISRMAIFKPASKAHRMIAANAGSYTLPITDVVFPLGLKNTEFKESTFKPVYSTKLTILVGELDNDQETKGTLLHTPQLDKQGLGRLSRAKSLFSVAKSQAELLNMEFNWQINIAKDIGHEAKAMSNVAAKLLYDDTEI